LTENNLLYQHANIFYLSTGKGKRVILLHGFAEDGSIWENQIAFLKNHFRLLIPDIPGSGRSELIPDGDIETYTEVIKSIIADDFQRQGYEGSEEVTIIGHSMGGYIALAFAEKYPQELAAFGLFHSTAFADNEEKKMARAKAILFIKDKGSNPFLQTSIPGLFSQTFATNYPAEINKLLNKSKNFSQQALIQYYEAMIQRPDRTEVLKKFPKPILFIIGEKDNVIPLQNSLQQCYLPSQAHIHIVEKSAHMGMLEETEKSNKILYNFLKLKEMSCKSM
jgi:pimeloyl-ACP methyl ester carboxylesterase